MEQALGSAQSYRGTVGYTPPEVYQEEGIDFAKCDIWALGLVVWITLSGGSRYVEHPKVDCLLKALRSSHAKADVWKEDIYRREPIPGPGYELFMISGHLCQLAVDFAEVEFGSSINSLSLTLVKHTFRISLQKDPMKRCGDVSTMPFFYSKHR